MSEISKTMICRNVVAEIGHTGAVHPEPEGAVGLRPKFSRLLSELPTRLSTELFAGDKMVRLPAGQVLFRAGDSGDSCYRIEDGLLKVTIVSGSGAERILAFLGRGAIVSSCENAALSL